MFYRRIKRSSDALLIDFILGNNINSIKDVKALNKSQAGSDHRLSSQSKSLLNLP